ncbi:hypothetical protein OB2597_19761 [Pseudooceanicola batsensis HTCC2597]|uniref:Uncharacterized protein n=1 Tax=Pseudooceanicola batsensis (strain ATCC BAA-863 / DSM 15984 / KCTC 12145 / HTCC2597) TaxID=252305 RepID=A3U0R2_PSEBH|nr:hypothetical protein [Pseudooceanicola batsensis]EAQ02353.1 hypothetical protein OB2597_19761 [Pseudooceanicola batsensis HTCC2597]
MTHSPFDPDESLTETQKRRERAGVPRPEVEDTRGEPSPGYRAHPAARIFVRGPWEMAASILIGLGVVMMMQPWVMVAFTWSFLVTLTGTVMFLIVSHFPE